MKNYYRVILGKGHVHADECFAGGFIGTDFDIHEDLTNKLGDDMRSFNKVYRPILMAVAGKTVGSAGQACGALWTVSKGMQLGDTVLCPDGLGHYHIGEVNGVYYYKPGEILFHRRPVKWQDKTIDRAAMSEPLQNSTGSSGTVSNVTDYRDEIEWLLNGGPGPIPTPKDDDEPIQDFVAFSLEMHLEKFLVKFWEKTELGLRYDICKNEQGKDAVQLHTDTGRLDILAQSKDKKELLVIELKKGRASDAVVGQVLRYMGFVKDMMAEDDQAVKGLIIALDDDQGIRRALQMTPDIEFNRYQVNFKLVKA